MLVPFVRYSTTLPRKVCTRARVHGRVSTAQARWKLTGSPNTYPSLLFKVGAELGLGARGAFRAIIPQTSFTLKAGTEALMGMSMSAVGNHPPLPDYGEEGDRYTQFLMRDTFSLLDVSTNADLFGVSFGVFDGRRTRMITTHIARDPNRDPARDAPAENANDPAEQAAPGFPLQVRGIDVVSPGNNVRAFTVPQISWEPVFNLTRPQIAGDPSDGFNYYPDDGGPTRIFNSSLRSERPRFLTTSLP